MNYKTYFLHLILGKRLFHKVCALAKETPKDLSWWVRNTPVGLTHQDCPNTAAQGSPLRLHTVSRVLFYLRFIQGNEASVRRGSENP